MSVDDKYTYPGSGGVLRNRQGIREAARLDHVMNQYASVEWAVLRTEPLPDRFNFGYLAGIHRRFFGEVLTWAGEIRDVDAQAGSVGLAYCRPEYIATELSTLFSTLRREHYLHGLDAREFADRLAVRWADLTLIHPFRDGNTRTQGAFVSRLAESAGHPIAWTRIDVDQLRDLRLVATVGREDQLADYLHDRLLEPGPRAAEEQSHLLSRTTDPGGDP